MTEREFLLYNMIKEIDRKVSRQTWLRDFSSNIAGNAAWDAALWIAKRLPRLFR